LSEYTVTLDVYNGPLDLLLFLIRREEVDIHDIPISRVTEQYLQYVSILERLDPEATSEFLVLAATLAEIKSRMLLPHPPPEEEGQEEFADPRMELVRQLLAYKAFKDAARRLEGAATVQGMRFPRVPAASPGIETEHEIELDHVEIWDLFDAFRRLLEQIGQASPFHEVRIDETPLALHAEDITDAILRAGGVLEFAAIFLGRGVGEAIGLFLALLEMIRQRRARVSQDAPFGPILIHLLDESPIEVRAEGDVIDDLAEARRMAREEDGAEPGGDEDSLPGGIHVLDDVPDDDEDEFSRQLAAIPLAEVDLELPPERPHVTDPDREGATDEAGASAAPFRAPDDSTNPEPEEPSDEPQ
jgi:segregation and condensation protein A